MNWNELSGIHLPVAEILLRGTCIYWGLFLLFRFVLRRDVGAVGIADILLLVIIADAAQNAMAGEYKSITEGLLLVATIAAWNLLLDWLSYQFRGMDRLVKPQVLPLVRHGRVLRQNLGRELMTVDDLMSKLRQQGIYKLDEVRHACMESDGEISVIKRKRQSAGGDTQNRPPVRKKPV